MVLHSSWQCGEGGGEWGEVDDDRAGAFTLTRSGWSWLSEDSHSGDFLARFFGTTWKQKQQDWVLVRPPHNWSESLFACVFVCVCHAALINGFCSFRAKSANLVWNAWGCPVTERSGGKSCGAAQTAEVFGLSSLPAPTLCSGTILKSSFIRNFFLMSVLDMCEKEVCVGKVWINPRSETARGERRDNAQPDLL